MMYVKNFVDATVWFAEQFSKTDLTTVWFAKQFNKTDFIKTVGDLVVDAEVIVSKVQGVVPESLRNMAAFAKEFKWVKNLFNLADRVKNLRDFERKDFNKKANLVSLTAAHIFGFIQSLHELGLVELGNCSPYTKLAQEICYIPASFYEFKGLYTKKEPDKPEADRVNQTVENKEKETLNRIDQTLNLWWQLQREEGEIDEAKVREAHQDLLATSSIRKKLKLTENVPTDLAEITEELRRNLLKGVIADNQVYVEQLEGKASLSEEDIKELKEVKGEVKFWSSVERNQEYLENLKVKRVSYFTRGEAGYQVNRKGIEGAFTDEIEWKEFLSNSNCMLAKIENIGKIALGVFGLLASFFGFKSIAIISSGMLLSWTFIHFVSFCRKLVSNAMEVDNTAAYRFPPIFDQM